MALRNQTRLLPAVPVVDSVPLMVCWESKVTVTTPADAGPVTARLLNVLVLLIDLVPVVVEVKVTLLNAKFAVPVVVKAALAEVQLI